MSLFTEHARLTSSFTLQIDLLILKAREGFWYQFSIENQPVQPNQPFCYIVEGVIGLNCRSDLAGLLLGYMRGITSHHMLVMQVRPSRLVFRLYEGNYEPSDVGKGRPPSLLFSCAGPASSLYSL